MRKSKFIRISIIVISILFLHLLWYSNLHHTAISSSKASTTRLHDATNNALLMEFLTDTTTGSSSSKKKASNNNSRTTTEDSDITTRTRKKKKNHDTTTILEQQKDIVMTPEMEYIRSFRTNFDAHNKVTRSSRPLALLHVPKCAGTSIEDIASSHNISWGACAFPRYKPRAVRRCPKSPHILGEANGLHGKWTSARDWWHMPRNYLPIAKVDPYMGHEIFAVVRDVYKRIISDFYFICGLRRPQGCNPRLQYDPNHLNEWIMEKLHRGRREFVLSQGQGLHSEEQYALVVSPNEVRTVDYVLHLENLEDEFNRLMDVFGMEDIHLNKVSNAHANRSRNAPKALSVEHLFPDTIKKLNKVYANDFEAFQYERMHA